MTELPAEPDELKNGTTLHHYDFGHVILREICSHNPMAFFQVLASPGKNEFLEHLWRIACERCDEQGPAPFSHKDVVIDAVRIEEYPVILVTMPRPTVPTEAFYIAVVLLTSMDRIVAGDIPEKPSFGYYTLELGIAPDEREYTMLCSWVDGKHVNFGIGPEAGPAAFLRAVAEKLQGTHETKVSGGDHGS
jgi:hypothetical protein